MRNICIKLTYSSLNIAILNYYSLRDINMLFRIVNRNLNINVYIYFRKIYLVDYLKIKKNIQHTVNSKLNNL